MPKGSANRPPEIGCGLQGTEHRAVCHLPIRGRKLEESVMKTRLVTVIATLAVVVGM
jgi:hypothetical protein